MEISRDLLLEALTHSTFSNQYGGVDYERLEFLGDAILDQVVTLEVFSRFPKFDENELSRRRNVLVSAIVLAEIARDLELGTFIRLGKGEVIDGGRFKTSILADVVESLIAAIFLEHGPDETSAFILRVMERFFSQTERFGIALDPKTAIVELFKERGLGTPEYEMTESGPPHDMDFSASLVSQGEILGTGKGRSKKQAQALAALAALAALSEVVD